VLKKVLKIAAWAVFIALLGFAMHFANGKHAERVMQFPEIVIESGADNAFLMVDDVVMRLNYKNVRLDNLKRKEINTDLIESIIKEMYEVQEASVHVNIDNTWVINMNLRRPIARVFNEKGESYYLDDRGKLMPTSQLYTAHVLPVSGNIKDQFSDLSVQEIINNDSLKTLSLLPQIYYLSEYVCNDPFLSALITQATVDKNGDFVLTPIVGNQKIIFGRAENRKLVEERFKKLLVFYRDALPYAGWSKYESINLKYKNQVVCKKRGVE
jgi:cell division protein FtsQ